MNDLPLFQQFPILKEKLPFIPLGDYPTRVSRLSNLENVIPAESFWIKRDDETTSLYGGNKVRKLEFELGKALEKNSKVILAYSSIGSNFTIATALFAKQLNMKCHLVLFDIERTPDVEKNRILNEKLADKSIICSSPYKIPYHVLKELSSNRNKGVFLMPPGGTSALSTFGYINALFELKEQVDRGELPMPDYIFLSVGTGGTLVGLLIAKVLLNLPTKIIGIAVVDQIISNSWVIKLHIYRCVNLFNKLTQSKIIPKQVFNELYLDKSFIGKGYACVTKEGLKTKKLLEDREGITLDTTYTCKGMFGAMDYIKNKLDAKKNFLFWHSYNSNKIDFD